jgi:uncharacterized protein YkwD
MLHFLCSLSSLQRVVSVSLAVLLAACGGGGGEAESNVQPTVVAAATSDENAVTQATGSPSMSQTSCLGMRDRQAALDAINAARATGRSCGSKTFAPAQALQWNFVLEKVAVAHSSDMINRQFFAHMNPDGNKAGVRFLNAGYEWSSYGENLGKGQTALSEVMNEWLNSPTHCENLMDPDYKDFALACISDDAGARQTLYWTQLFGTKR